MDKNYIKNKYMDSLAEEEQHIISVFSVICIEGVSIDVLCNVLKPDNPREFNTLVEKFSAWNWLFSDNQTVYCDQQIAAVLEVKAIKADSVEKILSALREYLVLQPLDDMLKKQEYFVVARLFLTYLMKQWKASSEPTGTRHQERDWLVSDDQESCLMFPATGIVFPS